MASATIGPKSAIRLDVAKVLFALALLCMPLTYGLKSILGLPESLLWVDPTLVLSFVLFLLMPPPLRPLILVVILVSTLISAFWGIILLRPEGGMYDALREPLRLALNIVWFWVSLRMLELYPRFVLRWLSWSTIAQFTLAFIFWLGSLRLISLPGSIGAYVTEFAARQALWLKDFSIPRIGGTFIESPPFGLFMFSVLVVLSLAWLGGTKSRLLRLAWVCALFGVVLSFSSQILVSLTLFLVGLALWHLRRFMGKGSWMGIILLLLLLPVTVPALNFVGKDLSLRVEQTNQGDGQTFTSGGERFNHALRGISILSSYPAAILWGIGPGRYGEHQYPLTDGFYPQTVTMQVTPVEWLVEQGAVGFSLIVIWLYIVALRIKNSFGWFGIITTFALFFASAFQANWKWESWFFAMAYLYMTPIMVKNK